MWSHSFLLPLAGVTLLMIASYQHFSVYLFCAAAGGETKGKCTSPHPHALAGHRQRQWPEQSSNLQLTSGDRQTATSDDSIPLVPCAKAD